MATGPALNATYSTPEQEQEPLGLRQHILSPLETLAQSISTIAPSTSPMLTIPLVFAISGSATWLAYLLALICMVLMAFCIAIFARDSATAGSLYSYTRSTLPPIFATISALALLFAYMMTASSMLGGLLQYSYVSLGGYGHLVPPAALALLFTSFVVWTAYRDIKISTRCMLWIEGVTMFLILIVLAAVLWRHGTHIDRTQFAIHRSSIHGIQLGVVLAVFSFVGFESATTLGAEAHSPLRTIPRAVVGSAVVAGIFFILCSYTEVLGFGVAGADLGTRAAPLRFLADDVGMTLLGPLMDAGVVVSMFACMLACVVAAARVLLLMAHHGLAHGHFRKVHVHNQTPWAAGIFVGILAVIPAAILAQRGSSGSDIYGWMGSLAVYGFLTAYGLVAVSLPIYLFKRRRLTPGAALLSALAVGAVCLAMLGSLFPVPPAPYCYLPYIYVAYLITTIAWAAFFSTARDVPKP